MLESAKQKKNNPLGLIFLPLPTYPRCPGHIAPAQCSAQHCGSMQAVNSANIMETEVRRSKNENKRAQSKGVHKRQVVRTALTSSHKVFSNPASSDLGP